MYQKGGVLVDGESSYANVTQNEIRGDSALTGIIAQNGVQISRNASADVDHNVVDHNTVHGNRDDGIAAFTGSSNNTISYNKGYNNTLLHFYDDTVGGGTAATANYWLHDQGDTENHPGLCKHSS